MRNERRIVEGLMAAALAVGGVSDAQKAEKSKIEQTETITLEKKGEQPTEVLKESEADLKFKREHPIAAELQAEIQHLPKEQQEEAFVQLSRALADAQALVREKRFEHTSEEKRYFSVCYNFERWREIYTSAQFASDKTGIPLRTLIGIGFLESKFKTDASREDTGVYGAFQMTIDTAKAASRSAKKVFGFPIPVRSSEDLFVLKNNMRLAALRLKSLEKQFGQLGLAITAYAGGDYALEKKIVHKFPKIDLGHRDWEIMVKANREGKELSEKVKTLTQIVRSGRATPTQTKELSIATRALFATRDTYIKAKLRRDKKRADIPGLLRAQHVNILTLHDAFKKDGDVPHSITYPLMLDTMGELAEKHVNRAKKNRGKLPFEVETKK